MGVCNKTLNAESNFVVIQFEYLINKLDVNLHEGRGGRRRDVGEGGGGGRRWWGKEEGRGGRRRDVGEGGGTWGKEEGVLKAVVYRRLILGLMLVLLDVSLDQLCNLGGDDLPVLAVTNLGDSFSKYLLVSLLRYFPGVINRFENQFDLLDYPLLPLHFSQKFFLDGHLNRGAWDVVDDLEPVVHHPRVHNRLLAPAVRTFMFVAAGPLVFLFITNDVGPLGAL